MAMGPERSKALHNFSMPRLKWGNQRSLRCVKVSSESSPRAFNNENEEEEALAHHSNEQLFQNSNDIEAVREKLMIDLRVAADKLKVSIFEEGNPNPNPNPTRPWNLRTRRASCSNRPQHTTNPLHSVAAEPGVLPNDDNNNNNKKKKIDERAKVSVSLSKEEKEQDFWALLGTRPPRRPKKRPRIVQKQLDTLFPGLGLTEVTAESYKVPDVPE